MIWIKFNLKNIFFLDGKIVEMGTYNNLISQNGKFAKLIEEAKAEKARKESIHVAEDELSSGSSDLSPRDLVGPQDEFDDSAISLSENLDLEGHTTLMRYYNEQK